MNDPQTGTPVAPKARAELRYCNDCQQRFPASSLKWLAGFWLCPGCTPAEPTEAQLTGEVEETPDVNARFAATDRILRYTGVTAHFAAYGGACWLAHKNTDLAMVLQGGVLADCATWLMRAAYELRDRALEVLLDLAGFAIVIYVVLGSDVLAIPAEPAGRGLSFLGFLAVFTVKGIPMAHRMINGDRETFYFVKSKSRDE